MKITIEQNRDGDRWACLAIIGTNYANSFDTNEDLSSPLAGELIGHLNNSGRFEELHGQIIFVDLSEYPMEYDLIREHLRIVNWFVDWLNDLDLSYLNGHEQTRRTSS